MADVTPLYGFPYLELGDPPDLASGTEDLATAVETKLAAMNTTPTLQLFTVSGTWTKPANLKAVRVRVIGAGAPGGNSGTTAAGQGSAGGGGGGGEYAEAVIPAATLAATVAVTCGAALGQSSFGAHVIALPGASGASSGVFAAGTALGGAGGSGGGGSFATIFRRAGADGDMGRVQGGEPIPARGGNSGLAYGAGGQQVNTILAGAGQAGKPFGGGGSGAACRASQSAQSGGAGATGGVIVENLF